MIQERVIVGERLTIEVDPDGWPFHVTVGDTEEMVAMPERIMDRRGNITAQASVTIPELAKGQHDIILRDRNGRQRVGSVIIT